MADQTVRISNLPDSGTPARVAYDLTMRIATAENPQRPPANPREYYLALYQECRKVVF